MDENSGCGNRVIELGPSTLDCLRRLSDAIERLIGTAGTAGTAGEAEALSCPDSIQSPDKRSPYFDAEEAASYLGTTVNSLYGLVERRQIEPLRGTKRRYRFTREMLDEYLQRGRRR